MSKKVSIIIPAYNCEKTIEKCLNSIIQQTYKNIEIIVINDGSNDNTANILKKYQKLDERISVIQKENSGVSDTRNLGIDKSTGSYLSFVDSDDWLEINMIEEMVNAIEKQNVDFVRCNYYCNSSNGTQIEASLYELANHKFSNQQIYTSKAIEHFLFFRQHIKNLVMLLLIKKEFLFNNDIYFDTQLYMLEDVYFYQRIFKKAKEIYFLDKPLYHYYENENSVTRMPEKYTKMIYGIIDANTKITSFILENKIVMIDLKKLNANHLRIICDYLYFICLKYKRIDFINLIRDLKNNEKYNEMLENIDTSELTKKGKLQIKILYFRNSNITYMFMKILSLVCKIVRNKKYRKG